MKLLHIGRGVTFLAGAVVGGLALAFVLVLLRPELLPRLHPSAPAGAAASPAAATTNPAVAPSSPAGAPVGAVVPEPAAQHSFSAAVHRAAPAVVNVYTDRKVVERVSGGLFDDFFGPRYRQGLQSALGSGVIVDTAGHILTNNHVVANAETIRVQLADGRQSDARVVGLDPDTDLAVLKINLKELPVMPLGRSDQLQVGDEVLAIGNPLGLSQTVTHGIVSATGRDRLGVATFEKFIQTDAAINEGNSGGALIDADGQLVGINTAVLAKNATSAGVEGIGFAIPVNLARGVMNELLQKGHVVRGWIGIIMRDMDDTTAQRYGLARGGVVVIDMYRGSPAAAAGVEVGDIVQKINGRAVRGAQDAESQLATLTPGGKSNLQLLRGTAEIAIATGVGERPTLRAGGSP